ncbi:hypothetical protein FB451DRAFT_1535553 [Mycena latifolia]|nr:hypothetical protein FB451DRAFT_1535553 [Mycena latifolia]
MIGRTGIGYSFDKMIPGREADDKYAVTLKELLPTVFKMGILFPLLPWVSRIGSPTFRRFLVNAIPSRTLHKARDLVATLESTENKLIAEKAAVKGGQLDVDDSSRDIMSLLLKGNLMADEDMFLTNARADRRRCLKICQKRQFPRL